MLFLSEALVSCRRDNSALPGTLFLGKKIRDHLLAAEHLKLGKDMGEVVLHGLRADMVAMALKRSATSASFNTYLLAPPTAASRATSSSA